LLGVPSTDPLPLGKSTFVPANGSGGRVAARSPRRRTQPADRARRTGWELPSGHTQPVSIGASSFDTPAIVRRFQEARRGHDLVVLQGFHALKHALRFGAAVELVACSDMGELARLGQGLAPDLIERMQALAVALPVEAFKRLGPYVPHTGVVSIARRVVSDPIAVLAAKGPAPLVLLEDPRHFGNLGAVIRVAAAVGAAGVLTTGRQDPWDPVAVRGSAGLHFALPVARLEGLPETDRPLLALDPDGDELRPEAVPPRALLAFGTERDGLSEKLLERADARLRLPMREGVSSLNLATSVAAVLYGLRLARAE
jgi:TrmH family RNA methyltransferase